MAEKVDDDLMRAYWGEVQMDAQKLLDAVGEAAEDYAKGDPEAAQLVLAMTSHYPDRVKDEMLNLRRVIEERDGVTVQDWLDRHRGGK